MSSALLAPLVAASDRLGATSSRNEKVAIIAEALRGAGEDVRLAATYLAGDPPQDRLEVGWATIRDLDVAPATTPTLSLVDVDAALEALATAGGTGSRGVRVGVLTDLYAAATVAEQSFLNHLVLGEMRQGALAGLVVKGIAAAAQVPETVVRRAVMLAADLGEVASLAMTGGRAALEAVGLVLGRGVQPMLAATSPSVAAAVEDMGTAVVEWKLDGARIQVHKDGSDVVVYTRNLNDVTARSPDTVAVAQALEVERVILDGEVLAVGADDRPVAFQDTMSTFSNIAGGGSGLTPFFFDVLHVDGEDLLDAPLTERRARLAELVDERNRIPSAVVSDPEEGEGVLADALEHGHEGVVVKALDAPYAAGRRGKAWRKVKPVRTLDLVVLAVEWGSGRRRGWLSNIHLGAVDDRPGHEGFVMLGKTFKGMTDEVLAWQTERFLSLETHRDGHVVHVRPEQVVEIALDGIQTSRRYPGGIALRFARVVRYRDDKDPDQADALSTVRALGSGG
ncbi:ATP-dependent DNA ligase [Euzebya sp.]|uniref:ATP-dependent DNA ligase n=1 Tax=Euzebya sp. TaxID=1971409 RepID=UPI003515017F